MKVWPVLLSDTFKSSPRLTEKTRQFPGFNRVADLDGCASNLVAIASCGRNYVLPNVTVERDAKRNFSFSSEPVSQVISMLAAFRRPKLVCSFPDSLPSVRHLSSLRIAFDKGYYHTLQRGLSGAARATTPRALRSSLKTGSTPSVHLRRSAESLRRMMEARRYALTTVSRSSPKTGEPSGSRTSIETVSPKAM